VLITININIKLNNIIIKNKLKLHSSQIVRLEAAGGRIIIIKIKIIKIMILRWKKLISKIKIALQADNNWIIKINIIFILNNKNLRIALKMSMK
jgi:hypothetical protein